VTVAKIISDVFKNLNSDNNRGDKISILAKQQVSHKTKLFRLKLAKKNAETESKILNEVTHSLKYVKLSFLKNFGTSLFVSIELSLTT
jgi:hypothetical protein